MNLSRFYTLGSFVLLFSFGQAAPTIVRGPYLQSATPTSMVVRWRTDTTESSVVAYGTARDQLTLKAKAEGVSTEHIVQLSGLQPGTRYFYAVGSINGPIPSSDENALGTSTGSFTTPPETGKAQPTRIWVLGDPGTKNATQAAVRDVYTRFTGSRPTDLWLMLGDNAYPDGTDTDFQKAVFEIYPELLRTSPLWPTLGNHDARSANSITQSGVYYDIFSLPTRGQAGGVASGTEAYYSFDYANIHFVCLDSHDTDRSAEGAMAQWLKADLAATAREWIVAFFHHPPYSKGSHDSDTEGRMVEMRQVVMPLLENGGVDLVLTGHSHNYERSFLIDGHYGKSDSFAVPQHLKQPGNGRAQGDGVYRKPRARAPHAGEISIVAGSSGHATPGHLPLNHPAMVVSLNEPGSVVLDIDGWKLDFLFLNDKGAKQDWFTIVKE